MGHRDKLLIGFAVTVAVLGLLAFTAWSLFEIYPDTKYVPPSREARTNDYLALDRWLINGGHKVRVEKSGDISLISRAPEKQIFIQSSLFRWTDEAIEYLVRWVEGGGTLFLALDSQTRYGGSYPNNDWDWDDRDALLFLEEFGITADTGTPRQYHGYDSESPSYDRGTSFSLSDEYSDHAEAPLNEALLDEALLMKDRSGIARLVLAKRGKGKLIASGPPYFLQSSNIGGAPDARLAWALFMADSGEAGSSETGPGDNAWFFIRGTRKTGGFWGSLFRQGNIAVILVSILVLLVIGFWTVIPVFGLVRGDSERPGKSLRERFLAEGRFLKKYGALEFYRQAYIKEIKRRLARKEGVTGEEETAGRVREILGPPLDERDSVLLARAFGEERFSYREFPRMIIIFKTILERI
jgi:hypothetical protein